MERKEGERVGTDGVPFMGLAEIGVRPDASGKVREILDLGEQLLIVTTDRLSAFDRVLPTGIPGRGAILNGISIFWFERLSGLVPSHFLSRDPEALPEILKPHAPRLAGRFMRARKAERVPIECVVRGWLAGSGYNAYRAEGSICGVRLPPGLEPFARLPQAIFTPTTKAERGHDEPVSFAQLRGIVGDELAAKLRELSLALYAAAAAHAEARGIVIADTKFEFGWIDGRLMLIDEALTPDCSRFWPRESVGPGRTPVSLDKQAVRDYLRTVGWSGDGPPPILPPEVVAETKQRYARAVALLTG
ncbi:MAG: phosphoribosylaminoimidazolesuccinocarboxamide synthase [Candidatus Eisenbacteria bacterium]